MIADLVSTKKYGKKKDCSKRVLAYEAAWARLQSETPGWATDPVDQDFQKDLLNWLRFHRGMLIGELVPEALRFLRNNPESPDLSAFDHVIIDEYQDLNRAEQSLIDLLAQTGNLAIVGDVDQSIYSFRHANPEGIESFDEQHPETYDQTLDICRRCPIQVVEMANDLIKNNYDGDFVPRLKPNPENGEGEVKILQWQNVDQEVKGIGEYVSFLIKDKGFNAGDIMILTPRRLLAYRLRDQIKLNKIPIHSFYNEEALDSESAQRCLTILTLLANPNDRVALRWWLGNGSTNFLSGQYVKLRKYCEETGKEPRAVLEEVIEKKCSLSGISHLIERYKELRTFLNLYSDKPVEELVDSLMPEENDELAILREVAIHAMLDNAETFSDLLESIRKFVTQPELPREGDFVRVMSLHKSKGLTCKVAIVVGCIQGLIPYLDESGTPEEAELDLKEQRRLFYVAITRGTDILVLSSVTHMERNFALQIGVPLPPGKGALGQTITSQFVDELGPTRPLPQSGIVWLKSGFK